MTPGFSRSPKSRTVPETPPDVGASTRCAAPASGATDAGKIVYRLAYHDLIAVPGAGPRHGIYWLRLYEAPEGHLAVVTEVPGNPGFSVDNGISQILEHLHTKFGVEVRRLALYEIWPVGSPGADGTVVSRVHLQPHLSWQSASRQEIEDLVGAPLPPLPSNDALRQRVLALGGGTTVEHLRPVFEAFPVAALPPPAPFRCAHTARFERLLEEIDGGAEPSRGARLEAGRRFLASLTPDDRAACRYHHGDWRAVADESVRIIQTLGPREREAYKEAAQRLALPERDRRWLVSLFASPVEIRGDEYSNGQHRACALRFSGAEHAAVVTHDESLGQEADDWEYVGDG